MSNKIKLVELSKAVKDLNEDDVQRRLDNLLNENVPPLSAFHVIIFAAPGSAR